MPCFFFSFRDHQENIDILEEPFDDKSSAPLPILCIEDGKAILRFSEIFGIHESLKKAEKRDRRYSVSKGNYFLVPNHELRLRHSASTHFAFYCVACFQP